MTGEDAWHRKLHGLALAADWDAWHHTRRVFADWLEERGRVAEAVMARAEWAAVRVVRIRSKHMARVHGKSLDELNLVTFRAGTRVGPDDRPVPQRHLARHHVYFRLFYRLTNCLNGDWVLGFGPRSLLMKDFVWGPDPDGRGPLVTSVFTWSPHRGELRRFKSDAEMLPGGFAALWGPEVAREALRPA